ncbi:MAG: FAD-binding oxidoreductase [Gammaproteobacteria bacterium]
MEKVSLWKASTASGAIGSILAGDQKAQFVVVGGGFTGVSTALHLALTGASVILLEANQIGFGGSGRNVGYVNAGLWLVPDKVDALLGKEWGDRLYYSLAAAPQRVFELIEQYGIDCEATRNGTLHVAVGKSGQRQLQDRISQLSARGAPVELLNATETSARIGSSYFSASLFDPRAGTIQPLAYVRGLAQAACTLGVQIHENTPVNTLSRSKDGWRIITSSGSVTAEQVVLATNAYSGNRFSGLEKSFVPIYYSQLASEPLTAAQREQVLPNKEGAWDTCTVMSSFRLDQKGRFIIGGMGCESDALTPWGDNRVKKWFPSLGKLKWQYAWSGRIAFSDDHVPHFHQLDEGLYSLIGYSGRGIAPGTKLGQCLAQWLTGDRDSMPLPLTPLKETSCRWLKAAFYDIGARVYHLGQRVL